MLKKLIRICPRCKEGGHEELMVQEGRKWRCRTCGYRDYY